MPVAPGLAAGEAAAPALLDEIVVVSTRSPRPVSEVVGMVSVLDYTDLETRLATHDEGLWRDTPSVEVESSGSRFTARSVSIRGIGGNRVLVELDGVPVQERFAVGSVAYAGRQGSDLDFVRRVEVLRGPASSLYGSKAIGGVVAVSTFDPVDLAGAGAGLAGRLRAAYTGDVDGLGASAIGAWQGEAHGLLLGASHRRSHEPGRSANPPDPDRLDGERHAGLAKWTWEPSEAGRLRLTVDTDRDHTRSEMNSIAGQGRFASSTQLLGNDHATRTGVAFDGGASLGLTRFEGVVFHRATRTRQETLDLREALARPLRIDREFRYDTRTDGLRLRATREFETGGLRHRVLAGAEVARSRLDQWRDATQTGLLDGVSTKVVLGERFPLRDFPLTETVETGVFVQDEIEVAGARWTVIPSLRLDRTRISVRDDDAWRQANPEAELAELAASDLSPRIGVLWRPSARFQAWGQLASGFRAPPAEDLNIGLDIPLFRTRALPNPELKSESSLGWEAGIRANARGAWLSVAGFWTDYEDFIVSLVPLGPDPETGTLLFQSQNVARARIRGVEFESGLPLGLLSPRLDAFGAGLSGYWARGEDRRGGGSLDDVGPASALAFVDWASASGHWSWRLSTLVARGKVRGDDATAWFRVPGHGVVDLVAAWRAGDRLTVRAGVFNLGDKTWWRWGEARRLPANDPLIPALSAPGRSASISFTLGFGPGPL